MAQRRALQVVEGALASKAATEERCKRWTAHHGRLR